MTKIAQEAFIDELQKMAKEELEPSVAKRVANILLSPIVGIADNAIESKEGKGFESGLRTYGNTALRGTAGTVLGGLAGASIASPIGVLTSAILGRRNHGNAAGLSALLGATVGSIAGGAYGIDNAYLTSRKAMKERGDLRDIISK